VLLLAVGLLVAGCSPAGSTLKEVVAVPADAPTITAALQLVQPGGLVLVSPGVYTESVIIDVEDVTLRGTDRNGVIIDGEGLRPQGVLVVANGVTVENLTVRSHTFNGVLVTGLYDGTNAEAHGVDGYNGLDTEKFPPLQRFDINHVTAYNNGLYGIYAFDSQHGSITDSYASGSADSGFYVGQCQECDILVQGNIAENNAIGFENANASDSLYILGNRWSSNRVGMTLISNYQEAFVPQRATVVAGNLISDNMSAESPTQADGGFGIGLGIAGGQQNQVLNNRIAGNARAGVILNNSEDISAIGNAFTGNQFADNGLDIIDTSAARAPSSATCISGLAVILPAALAATPCDPTGAAVAGENPSALPLLDVPAGMSFLKIPAPPAQPSKTGALDTVPPRLPGAVTMPDVASFGVPAADFLAAP